jgi:hypothetical protein
MKMNFNTRLTITPHTLGGFDFYTVETTEIIEHELGGYPYYTVEPTTYDREVAYP